jgi:c-di-GMP-binding flagellar brake protein YcgR
MGKVSQHDNTVYRAFVRVPAKSVIVSLASDIDDKDPITGFLRDISEGGLRIQKLSQKRQVEAKSYLCSFSLPESGKIETHAEVVGFGDHDGKFAESYIRMRFITLTAEQKKKIKQFISLQGQSEK